MPNLNRREAAGDYRADIDGLRAIAVLSVIFYHYHIGPFNGGFVGVDIFFVISGYLITRLINAELTSGCFSFAHFYERRIRRIFPALFVLLFLVTILALIVLFPRDLQRFSESLWATAIFYSNVTFYREAGYFDTDGISKPLLHTWSLAVEEQFYLIWPTILYILASFGKQPNTRRILCGVSAIFALSLIESVRHISYHPAAGFYLLPSRMWELMLGAMLAVGNLPRIRNPIIRDTAAAAGFLLIGWSVYSYNADTAFPGLAALVPCLGAALLIYTGEKNQTLLAKVLSTRPLVFIGLISYSLYLWHWPLYVYANYLSPAALSISVLSSLILLSGVLAYLSYRFVEQPFRSRKVLLRGPKLFGIASTAITVTVIIGVALVSAKGLPQRYPSDVQKLLAARNDEDPRVIGCIDPKPENVRKEVLCSFGDQQEPVDLILWGDSHASALLPGLEQAAMIIHRRGLIASRSACPPLLGAERIDITQRLDLTNHQCVAFNDAVARAAANPLIHEIVLVARWSKDAKGTENDGDLKPNAFLSDNQLQARSIDENQIVFLRGLSRTLDFLSRAQKRIIIVGPIPEIRASVPETLAKARFFHIEQDARPTVAEFNSRQEFVLNTFKHLQQSDKFIVVYPDHALCSVTRCAIEKAGKPLYVDSHHLSVFGAEQLTPLLASVL